MKKLVKDLNDFRESDYFLTKANADYGKIDIYL